MRGIGPDSAIQNEIRAASYDFIFESMDYLTFNALYIVFFGRSTNNIFIT